MTPPAPSSETSDTGTKESSQNINIAERFVRISGRPEVYDISGNILRHVDSAEFMRLGSPWGAVKVILSSDIVLTRTQGKSEVYARINGTTAHIATAEIFARAGFAWSNVREVDEAGVSVAPAVACTPYITGAIKPGVRNSADEIRRLQIFLNTYQGAHLAVDGQYKRQDIEAVKAFQAKHPEVLAGLKSHAPDGQVSGETQSAMNRTYCEYASQLSCPYFIQDLQPGAVSAEVLKMKLFLNQTEDETLSLSSTRFDKPLTDAVKRFQKKYSTEILTPAKLKTPNGNWYALTRKKAHNIIGCTE